MCWPRGRPLGWSGAPALPPHSAPRYHPATGATPYCCSPGPLLDRELAQSPLSRGHRREPRARHGPAELAVPSGCARAAHGSSRPPGCQHSRTWREGCLGQPGSRSGLWSLPPPQGTHQGTRPQVLLLWRGPRWRQRAAHTRGASGRQPSWGGGSSAPTPRGRQNSVGGTGFSAWCCAWSPEAGRAVRGAPGMDRVTVNADV